MARPVLSSIPHSVRDLRVGALVTLTHMTIKSALAHPHHGADRIHDRRVRARRVQPIDPQTGALFAGLQNVILTPHVAGVTQDANKRISDVAVVNVRRVLGEPA